MLGCVLIAFALCSPGYYPPVAMPQPMPVPVYAVPMMAYYPVPAYAYGYSSAYAGGYSVNIANSYGGRGYRRY